MVRHRDRERAARRRPPDRARRQSRDDGDGAAHAEEAGVASRIEHIVGPALESLAQLDGPFDLVFIDADKPGYVDYYEAVLPKLAPDGVILADNTLSESVQPFNDHVARDDRVEFVRVPIRDGVTFVRRRA